jgi:hypothetical protein
MLAVIHHSSIVAPALPIALLTARPRRVARGLRYCSELDAPCTHNRRGRDMRICGCEKDAAPWRDAKFFSLALGLTAALAWPVRALAQASDQAPPKPENVLPPDQPFDAL